jgi:hypothetical protein
MVHPPLFFFHPDITDENLPMTLSKDACYRAAIKFDIQHSASFNSKPYALSFIYLASEYAAGLYLCQQVT